MQGIYQPKGKAAEYCENAVNLYRGCSHGCTYCYVPGFMHRTKEDFGKPEPRRGIIEQIKKDAPKYAGKEVLLCFTCDSYQPLNKYELLTMKALEIFQENKVKPVILTKGGLSSIMDFDILQEIPGARYGATLTFLDNEKATCYEPGAALPENRLFALEQAKKMGISTWVSLEPVIDPEESLRIIEKTKDIVDIFKIGKWNHSIEANKIDWKSFAEKAVNLCEKYNLKYYIKKDLEKFLEVKKC